MLRYLRKTDLKEVYAVVSRLVVLLGVGGGILGFLVVFVIAFNHFFIGPLPSPHWTGRAFLLALSFTMAGIIGTFVWLRWPLSGSVAMIIAAVGMVIPLRTLSHYFDHNGGGSGSEWLWMMIPGGLLLIAGLLSLFRSRHAISHHGVASERIPLLI